MTYTHTLYNALPSLEEANNRFNNRAEIFRKLSKLLAGSKFGVCLIHRHCDLREGEGMVAEGNVSSPRQLADIRCYPERWLANGEPYEFTLKETMHPPPSLFAEFREIVSDVGVLGLFYHEGTHGFISVERTSGRNNVVTMAPPSEYPADTIQTAWVWNTDCSVTNKTVCLKLPGTEIHMKVATVCQNSERTEPTTDTHTSVPKTV